MANKEGAPENNPDKREREMEGKILKRNAQFYARTAGIGELSPEELELYVTLRRDPTVRIDGDQQLLEEVLRRVREKKLQKF